MLLLETALASEWTIIRFFHGSELELLRWLLVAGLLLPGLNTFPAALLAVFRETLNKEPTQIEFDGSEWEKGKSQQTRVPKTQIQEDKPSKGHSVPISSCNRILERTS